MATKDDILNSKGRTGRANVSALVNAGVTAVEPAQPVKTVQAGTDNRPVNTSDMATPEEVNERAPLQLRSIYAGTDNTDTISRTSSPRLSYVQMMEKLSPYKPPTDEELKKERKRHRREAIFAAIGDGISALSNLYFTTQYAPNAYDPRTNMSERVRGRYDKIKAERDANQRTYMNAYLRAMEMDAAADRDGRDWRHRLGREAAMDNLKEREMMVKEAKADRDDALSDLKIQLYQGKITGQEYDNAVKEANARYAEAYQQSRINKNNRSGSGGGGRPAEYPWYDSNGKQHYAHSYEAMRQNAIQHGTWNETTQESTQTKIHKDRRGKETQTNVTTIKPAKGSSKKPEKAKPKKKETGVSWQ